MGSTLSTLAALNLSLENLVGFLLALPYFLAYFPIIFLKHARQEGYAGEVEKEEVEVSHLLRHQTLLTGFIPDLLPSSNESVDTVIVCNNKETIRTGDQQLATKTMPQTPSSADETLKNNSLHGTMETPSTAASTVHLEELSPLSEERSPLDEQPPPLTVIYESTSDYLEKVSKLLSKKAKAVPHSDKRGIADALLDLGQILFQQDKYKKALKVFQRAERVQKLVIDETLQAVASSMAHLAQHHHQAGNGVLARLYETLAMELETSPSAAVLKQSLQHHAQHRAAQGPSPRLVHAVDRRLKRASAEAVPLVQTLKLQAHCQELARNDS